MNDRLKHGGDDSIDRNNKEAEAEEGARHQKWLERIRKLGGKGLENG